MRRPTFGCKKISEVQDVVRPIFFLKDGEGEVKKWVDFSKKWGKKLAKWG